jgi:adenylate cyclase
MNTKTILIVDDSPTNIDILNDLLSEHRRQIATNGEKAIEIAMSDEPPDLILLDIEMPKMNGFEACEVLKANPRTQRIPIIFLTSKTDKETTIQGFELGASDFVTKPFNPAELTARVKTQLNLKDAQQKLEATIRQLETSSSLLKQSSEELSKQNAIADDLLLNILPEIIANELKISGHVKPRHFPIASVLFADLVGFSKISKSLSPKEIVDELNTLFVGFDLVLEKNRMEKIKTIGDGYMAAGEPGRLSISGVTYQLVKDKFKCVLHGEVDAKNMGKIDLYFCEHELKSR